ncbi:PrsW family intramembrane metalloprotease [Patescibacteria group bacterium]|nr:PrsW family intramembrane metalloprotease [Patescibacteria group bacterium]
MQYIFYILLGLLPSLIWLCFYLRKDKNPEPNSMILKIFFYGMLIAPIAIVFELLLIWLMDPTYNPLDILSHMPRNGFVAALLAATLIPALVEEYLKYAVVKFTVLKKSIFDEPTDAMIYCLIAGLGFASVENLMVLFKISFPDFNQALNTIGFRFLGATLVHALASAIVGYWLARGLLELKKRKKFILVGLTIAIIFHTCYNYFIVTAFNQTSQNLKLFFLYLIVTLLISVSLVVSYWFKKLKKQQSICLHHFLKK